MGIASLNRHIFAFGGYNGTKDLSSVEFYEPLSNCWTPTVSMGSKRSCLAVNELNGLLYAAGGYDGELWNAFPQTTIKSISLVRDFMSEQCGAI
jgi:hypothetical protein